MDNSAMIMPLNVKKWSNSRVQVHYCNIYDMTVAGHVYLFVNKYCLSIAIYKHALIHLRGFANSIKVLSAQCPLISFTRAPWIKCCLDVKRSHSHSPLEFRFLVHVWTKAGMRSGEQWTWQITNLGNCLLVSECCQAFEGGSRFLHSKDQQHFCKILEGVSSDLLRPEALFYAHWDLRPCFNNSPKMTATNSAAHCVSISQCT